MRARRAILYTPGDDIRKIRKATSLGVDCACLDMEDGVAVNRKSAAREIIASALASLDFGRTERLTRINAVGSGLESDDLNAVLPSRPDGIVIPKVETRDQVAWVSAKIAKAEQDHGWPIGEIRLIVIVETARGIVNLPQIVMADPRLQVLIFGAEDLAGDIGAQRSREGWEIFYARSAVLIHAAAYNLQAIDMVYIDFLDLDGLHQEALQGAHLGFAGKQIIHPNQVIPVQQAFTPDDQAISNAILIMQTFESHQRAGRGAFAMEGKMIDAPLIRAAEQILVRARAAGKIE